MTKFQLYLIPFSFSLPYSFKVLTVDIHFFQSAIFMAKLTPVLIPLNGLINITIKKKTKIED